MFLPQIRTHAKWMRKILCFVETTAIFYCSKRKSLNLNDGVVVRVGEFLLCISSLNNRKRDGIQITFHILF